MAISVSYSVCIHDFIILPLFLICMTGCHADLLDNFDGHRYYHDIMGLKDETSTKSGRFWSNIDHFFVIAAFKEDLYMDCYNLRPDYDPNLLPQWQGPSQIEEDFIRLVQRLYEQETNSLLYGSEYKEVNDELLSKRRQVLLERANPLMLRYIFPDEPSFGHEDNIDSFSKMKEDLIDPFESTKPEQAVSLSWDIDYLARNPYKALLSWKCTFDKYLESYKNSSAVIQPRTHDAFHMSTLYLLCMFIPGTHNDATFNPMQILDPLDSAFAAESKAFWTIPDVYPPIAPGFGGKSTKDISNVVIYDYTMHGKSVWHAPSDYGKRAGRQLYNIFRKHIKINGLEMDEECLDGLIQYIVGLSTQNGKVYYLLPFICAKTFSLLLCGNISESEIEESLYSYETLDRLFNNHHRKVQSDDIYYSDESKHPVINFMLDIVSLCYKIEMTAPKKLGDEPTGDIKLEYNRPEHEIMNQINTNWMILYLYGNRRLFNNPCICSYFCGLRLPVFLRMLFDDKEDSEDLCLDVSWLFALARMSDEHGLPAEDLAKLSADFKQELDKMSQSTPRWNEQLSEYIFDPSMWDDNSLKASSTEFKTQIDKINKLIKNAHMFLEQYGEGDDTPSMIVRGICISYLFEPIIDGLEYYLENLASLETYWSLIFQLWPYPLYMKEGTDSLQEWAT